MFTKADIEKYFIGEKQESILFLLTGIAAVIASIIFFSFLKTSFFKGAAIPLFLVGTMLGIVGFTIYKRSDGDRIRNVYAFDMNPSHLRNEELPRMKKVMKNFITLRYIEIFLFLAGAGLFIYFRNSPDRIFWKGFGLTFAIMAVISLTADYFAEQRGLRYTAGLETFLSQKQ